MAWEWSHTAEAYEAARQNCLELDRATLVTIWAEWQAYVTELGGCEHCEPDETAEFCEACYHNALSNAAALPDDVIAEQVWQWAEENRTCDNGGSNAWLCPHGCGPHCVPFDRED